MPETASSQLRRILHLIPMCEEDTPHPIEEMAAALDSDRATLLRDLKALSDRFDDPGGFVEGVQVFVDIVGKLGLKAHLVAQVFKHLGNRSEVRFIVEGILLRPVIFGEASP